MFRRITSDRLTKKIRLLLLQKAAEQKASVKSIGLAQAEAAEDIFVKSVIDPRLTAEENAILVLRFIKIFTNIRIRGILISKTIGGNQYAKEEPESTIDFNSREKRTIATHCQFA